MGMRRILAATGIAGGLVWGGAALAQQPINLMAPAPLAAAPLAAAGACRHDPADVAGGAHAKLRGRDALSGDGAGLALAPPLYGRWGGAGAG